MNEVIICTGSPVSIAITVDFEQGRRLRRVVHGPQTIIYCDILRTLAMRATSKLRSSAVELLLVQFRSNCNEDRHRLRVSTPYGQIIFDVKRLSRFRYNIRTYVYIHRHIHGESLTDPIAPNGKTSANVD